MNDIELQSSQGEIVMYQPDETIRLEVRMGEETVWLTQQQMAELFQRDQSVIARHIRNIYKEEELPEMGTYAKFAYMGHDGLQKYEVTHYNLDIIISVGYRVKSKRGTKFRQWAANKMLYQRGYADYVEPSGRGCFGYRLYSPTESTATIGCPAASSAVSCHHHQHVQV